MTMTLIIRCDKCGKVLKGKAQKSRIVGTCPRCKEDIVIPDPLSKENRKKKRAVICESKLVRTIPEALTKSEESPRCRVMYTEVSPVEYALNRSTHVPLLDLSEGGMGILMRTYSESKLLPGDLFTVEIDFPVLVQSIFIKVEVSWIRPIKEKLMHVGVRFCETDEPFREVLKDLMKYITSKTKTIDFEKWGSFG